MCSCDPKAPDPSCWECGGTGEDRLAITDEELPYPLLTEDQKQTRDDERTAELHRQIVDRLRTL